MFIAFSILVFITVVSFIAAKIAIALKSKKGDILSGVAVMSFLSLLVFSSIWLIVVAFSI